MVYNWISTILIAMIAVSISAQSTHKILFIGNSLTYWNDMPQLFEEMAAQKGKSAKCEQVVFPGVSLYTHFTSMVDASKGYSLTKSPDKAKEEVPLAISKLKETEWDYIVLQGKSNEYETLRGVILTVDSILGNSKTRILLFENYTPILWSKELRSKSVFQKRDTLDAIAKIVDADVIRVGEAFHLINEKFPSIELFPDDVHPSLIGSYIIAGLIYMAVYDEPMDVYSISEIEIEGDVFKDLLKTINQEFFKQ